MCLIEFVEIRVWARFRNVQKLLVLLIVFWTGLLILTERLLDENKRLDDIEVENEIEKSNKESAYVIFWAKQNFDGNWLPCQVAQRVAFRIGWQKSSHQTLSTHDASFWITAHYVYVLSRIQIARREQASISRTYSLSTLVHLFNSCRRQFAHFFIRCFIFVRIIWIILNWGSVSVAVQLGVK